MNYEEDENKIRTIFRNEAHLTTGIVDSCNIALKYIERCKQLEKDKLKLIDRKVSNSLDQIDTPIWEEEVYTMVLKSGVKVIVDMHLADYIESYKQEGNKYAYFEDSGFVQISEIAYIGNRKVI